MNDDVRLLRQYVEGRSEPAFGQIVDRHVNVVYSAAWRAVGGDAHLAQDVAQTVFADRARKAWGLPRGVGVRSGRHARWAQGSTVCCAKGSDRPGTGDGTAHYPGHVQHRAEDLPSKLGWLPNTAAVFDLRVDTESANFCSTRGLRS